MRIFVLLRFLFNLTLILLILCSCKNSTDEQVKINTPEKRAMADALENTNKLLDLTEEGSGEGQFPPADRSQLKSVEYQVRSFYNDKMASASNEEIIERVDRLYDACMEYESKVRSSYNDLIDDDATLQTRYLYENLKKSAPNYLLFGMHDATGYGVGWRDDNTRSDVKDVCGSYPAVFSWDVFEITRNEDLEGLKERMLFAYENGGINTLCWHQYDPDNRSFYYDKVNEPVVSTLLPAGENHEFYKSKLEKIARFIKSLRGSAGESVPIIFRPYHEQNGSWFWWGKGHRTEQEYIDLWQFTVHYLKNTLDVHNFIYAFSPDGNQYENKEDYLIDYPGDEYVDIMGVDFYFGKGDEQEVLRFQKRLIHAVQHGQERGKIAALTEAGDRYGWDDTDKLEISNWFTRCLLRPIRTSPTAMHIAYAAVWRNDNVNHHFAPYPGHESVGDFIAFFNDSATLFADDLANYYVLDSGL